MQLSENQKIVFNRIKDFLNQNKEKVLVLKGYAGTGKTTMVGFVLDYLKRKEEITFALMASTGRAAKILAQKTGSDASTIHALIYKVTDISGVDHNGGDPWVSESGQIIINYDVKPPLIDNERRVVLIVDEASMLSHIIKHSDGSARYGTGSILNDLMNFSGSNQIIFVGDPCQLPPVAKVPFSSSLDADFLRSHYNISATEVELKEIHRQSEGNEIISMAAKIRKAISEPPYAKYPKLPFPNKRNVHLYKNEQSLLMAYIDGIDTNDYSKSIVISDSNKKCQELNLLIRKALGRGPELEVGDLLMVTKNSYVTPLVNGDQVVVESIDGEEYYAGFNMLNVRVKAIHNGIVYETLLIKELLFNAYANLPSSDFNKLMREYDKKARALGIERKSKLYMDKLNRDKHVNALQVKYGYSATCHKAQGGEWPHVFLNISKSLYRREPHEVLRWFYTAVTRAGQHLHINDGYWIEGINNRQAFGI